jgi:hypothetical protein
VFLTLIALTASLRAIVEKELAAIPGALEEFDPAGARPAVAWRSALSKR